MYRIVIAQLLVTLLLMLGFAWIDQVTSYSLGLGGLIAALPNGFMAWRLNRPTAGAGGAFKALVVGEVGKLMLTALLFAAAYKWVTPLDLKGLFAALVLVMLMNVVVPLVSSGRTRRDSPAGIKDIS